MSAQPEFTTIDYRYEVFTESAEGLQLEGDHAARLGLAKTRGLIMFGRDNEAARVYIFDRMARVGRPRRWKHDGATWEVTEVRAAVSLVSDAGFEKWEASLQPGERGRADDSLGD